MNRIQENIYSFHLTCEEASFRQRMRNTAKLMHKANYVTDNQILAYKPLSRVNVVTPAKSRLPSRCDQLS